MSVIRATFKQLIKTGDYETATVDLGAEIELPSGSVESGDHQIAERVATLYGELAKVGESLLADRLASRQRITIQATARRQRG